MIVRNQADIDALREGGKRLARHLRILSEMVVPGVTGQQLEEKAGVIPKDVQVFKGLLSPTVK